MRKLSRKKTLKMWLWPSLKQPRLLCTKVTSRQKPTRKKKAPNSTFKDYFVILNHVCGK
ncbi:unnamed protein product, partial [Brassica rapa]